MKKNLLKLTSLFVISVLTTLLTKLAKLQLLRCINLVALGYVVKFPTLRTLKSNYYARTFLLCHRPP